MKERRKEGLRSRQERIANEILMYFRSMRKTAGDVSLMESIDADGEGNELSLIDVLAEEDDMLEQLSIKENCRILRRAMDTELDQREREILVQRYGLDNQAPRTQREIARLHGISRSYVSRIEKRALEKLKRCFSAQPPDPSAPKQP